MDTSAGALGDSVLNVAPKIKKERESTLLVFLLKFDTHFKGTY